MNNLNLSPEQQGAIRFVIEAYNAPGRTVVCIEGPAGSGKSTLIKELVKVFVQGRIIPVVAAPTHKAALVLRSKGIGLNIGIELPATIHRAALQPRYTEIYYAISECTEHPNRPAGEAEYFLNQELPKILAHPAVKRRRLSPEQVKQILIDHEGSITTAFTALGLDVMQDGIDGWEPRMNMGAWLLIVDEASMLSGDHLKKLQQLFTNIVLIGDTAQLQPVNAEAVFWQIQGRYALSEVWRQQQGSTILDLAGWVRYAMQQGVPHAENAIQAIPLTPHSIFYQEGVQRVQMCDGLLDTIIHGTPLICWTNKTRVEVNTLCRARRGYEGLPLQVGEPVVIKQNDYDYAYSNNEVAWIQSRRDHDGVVRLQREEGTEIIGCWDHFDGFNPRIDDNRVIDPSWVPRPRTLPLQAGYTITAHGAQGGQWPCVIVDLESFRAQLQYGAIEPLKWLYTAVTRASVRLILIEGMEAFVAGNRVQGAGIIPVTGSRHARTARSMVKLDAVAAVSDTPHREQVNPPVNQPASPPAGPPREVNVDALEAYMEANHPRRHYKYKSREDRRLDNEMRRIKERAEKIREENPDMSPFDATFQAMCYKKPRKKRKDAGIKRGPRKTREQLAERERQHARTVEMLKEGLRQRQRQRQRQQQQG